MNGHSTTRVESGFLLVRCGISEDVCMWVHMSSCVCLCMLRAEVKSGVLISPFPFCLLRQGLSLNSKLAFLVILVGYQALGVPSSCPSAAGMTTLRSFYVDVNLGSNGHTACILPTAPVPQPQDISSSNPKSIAITLSFILRRPSPHLKKNTDPRSI